jgi:hypothetical protein
VLLNVVLGLEIGALNVPDMKKTVGTIADNTGLPKDRMPKAEQYLIPESDGALLVNSHRTVAHPAHSPRSRSQGNSIGRRCRPWPPLWRRSMHTSWCAGMTHR